MQTTLVLIMLGLLGGIAVGLQGPLSSLMSGKIGIWESIFIVHLGGAILSFIPLLLFFGGGNLSQWRSVPWYALGAGAMGLVVIGAVSITIPKLGVAPTVTLIVVAQLILGAILDHYGWLGVHVRPLDVNRILGMLALFIGTWLMVK